MNRPQSADLLFENIEVGASASFLHQISERDVDLFAEISGDWNPLHVDSEYAAQTRFGRRVVHGMLLAALLSRLVGMHLPGRRCLYLSQSLDFVAPVHCGDEVKVSGEVQRRSEASRVLILDTSISHGDRLIVKGKATVQVLK